MSSLSFFLPVSMVLLLDLAVDDLLAVLVTLTGSTWSASSSSKSGCSACVGQLSVYAV